VNNEYEITLKEAFVVLFEAAPRISLNRQRKNAITLSQNSWSHIKIWTCDLFRNMQMECYPIKWDVKKDKKSVSIKFGFRLNTERVHAETDNQTSAPRTENMLHDRLLILTSHTSEYSLPLAAIVCQTRRGTLKWWQPEPLYSRFTCHEPSQPLHVTKITLNCP
jgi:hypothetical protein